MPAKDFGTKFTCHKCGTKYYDMRKPDPVCPKCGADQKEAQATTGKSERKSRLSAAPKIVAKVEPAVEEAAASEDEELEAIEPAEDEEAEEEP